jgi:hypothetical protein
MSTDTLSIALIGTSRGGADVPLPPVATDAAARLPPTSPERTLLNRAIMLFACQACGAKPASAEGEWEPPCKPDVHPPCSPRAGDILHDLLADNSRDLLSEWLQLARAAGKRPPHRLLPTLLDYAAKHAKYREAIAAIVDRRGEWLVAQNPEWQFAASADEDPEQVWETGTHAQRLSIFQSLRRTEPHRARLFLARTWNDESADHRAEFVTACLTGLSLDDEPFLESSLDDRSKVVRAAAADLLARLPQSKLVARMIERVTPLLAYHAPAAGSVLRLKKSSSARLNVELPKEYDRTWQRDGIEEKTAGKGQKQWWLEQMLGMIPPAHWSKRWSLSPAECVVLAGGDYATVLLDGWAKAGERNPDGDWIDALLHQSSIAHGGHAAMNRALLAALPQERFLKLALSLLQAKHCTLITCNDLINSGKATFDIALGREFIKRTEALAGSGDRQDASILWHMIEQCATRLPPALYDELAAKWDVEREPWSTYKRQVEALLSTWDIRRQIQREFSS